jgi:hypothetical protein
LEDWAHKQEKELREIYSLVKHSTIHPVIKNRGKASLTELAMAIFTNISYCGNHNAKMTSIDWANAIEDKAAVVCALFDVLEAELSEKEMFLFRARLPKSIAWKRVGTTVLLGGFSDKFRPRIKQDLQAIGATCFGEVAEIQKNLRNISNSLTSEMLSDELFIDEVIIDSPETIARLDSNLVDIETLAGWTRKILASLPERNRYSSFVINNALGDHLEFMDEVIEGNPMLISMAGGAYINDPYRMLKYITNSTDKGFENLCFIGDKLKDSVEFAKPFVESNSQTIRYFSDRVKMELANTGEVDLVAIEIEKLQGANTSYRRKVARTTKEVRVIEFLAKDRNEEIRIEVARRDITSSSILENYSKLKSVWLKGAVAQNANTPLPVLKAMIKTERDSHVFCSLAKNPNLALSDFLVLVKKPERYTRLMVLCNQKIAGFMHGGKLSMLREIVRTALAGNEEYFAYEMKVSSEFNPSFELLEDMKNNISLYVDMFPNMLLQVVNEMIECRFPHKAEKAEIVEVSLEDLALGGLFAA